MQAALGYQNLCYFTQGNYATQDRSNGMCNSGICQSGEERAFVLFQFRSKP